MFLAFLNEFDPDLKETFLEKLRVLWTHGSTGLEGNTLTLGETHAVHLTRRARDLPIIAK